MVRPLLACEGRRARGEKAKLVFGVEKEERGESNLKANELNEMDWLGVWSRGESLAGGWKVDEVGAKAVRGEVSYRAALGRSQLRKEVEVR